MTVATNEDVADRVRGAAAEKRVRQSELGDRLGVSRMAISRRLNGSTPFTPEELIKLSRLLCTPVATFFGEYAFTSPALAAPEAVPAGDSSTPERKAS